MDFSLDYDSRYAISSGSRTLEDFNRLIKARHHAHYVNRQTLREWVVLGRYFLDSCGNTMKYIGHNIPAVIIPGLPRVLTQKEFMQFIEDDPETKGHSYSCSISDDIPPANLKCPVCNQGWTIENCHDTVVAHENKVIDLDQFYNLKLKNLINIFGNFEKSVQRFQPDCALRNDLNIDPKNERGWIKLPDEDYSIKPGDQAMVNIWTYRHLHCHRLDQAQKERAYFERIFLEAGFQNPILTEIKNEYCDCTSCAPWYAVYADKQSFKVGWRKRVIELEVYDNRLDLTKLFAGEETTIGQNHIHAWGNQKCVEYLRKIQTSIIK